MNITPASSLIEYGVKVLRSEMVARALFENRAVRGLLGAIPGLDAYALLGKAWWHTTEMRDGRPRYDLVLFDGPASGHAALMLRIPQAILNAMPKGPLARDAVEIKQLLQDPARAALVIVTLAEDLPARETLELAAHARGLLGVPLGPVVVNALPTDALSVPAVDAVMAALAARARGETKHDRSAGPLQPTLAMAAGVRAHREAADRVLEGLKRDLGLPMITLPRIPTAEIRARDHRGADAAPCGANPIAPTAPGPRTCWKAPQNQLFATPVCDRYRGGGADPCSSFPPSSPH